jgi:flagellar basal body rod protein FlgG
VTQEGLFKETTASGPAFLSNPKQDGMGELQQGYFETSNVQLEVEVSCLATLTAWEREVR